MEGSNKNEEKVIHDCTDCSVVVIWNFYFGGLVILMWRHVQYVLTFVTHAGTTQIRYFYASLRYCKITLTNKTIYSMITSDHTSKSYSQYQCRQSFLYSCIVTLLCLWYMSNWLHAPLPIIDFWHIILSSCYIMCKR